MNKITYIKGDLFENLPKLHRKRYIVIPHIVNNIHLWGSGFVLAVNKYSEKPKEAYFNNPKLILGTNQFIKVKDSDETGPVFICNMVAQNGVVSTNNKKPIRYKALVECMQNVADVCKEDFGSTEIHAPKFGSDRARGNWNFIEELIEEIWFGIPTTIYHF